MSANTKIITVTSMKGGVGKTEVSLNLAVALKKKTGRRVVVVDFDIPYGGVAQALALTKEVSLSDWMDIDSEVQLTERQAESLVLKDEKAGIDVIPAIVDSKDVKRFDGKKAKNILEQLLPLYDYIVIDSGVDMSDCTKTALVSSDKIVLVTSTQNGSIFNNHRYKEELVSYGVQPNSILLFINQMPKKDADRQAERVEDLYWGSGTSIQTACYATLDPMVTECRNNKEHIYLTRKKSNFSQGIDDLTDKLGFLSMEDEFFKNNKKGFLHQMKRVFVK